MANLEITQTLEIARTHADVLLNYVGMCGNSNETVIDPQLFELPAPLVLPDKSVDPLILHQARVSQTNNCTPGQALEVAAKIAQAEQEPNGLLAQLTPEMEDEAEMVTAEDLIRILAPSSGSSLLFQRPAKFTLPAHTDPLK